MIHEPIFQQSLHLLFCVLILCCIYFTAMHNNSNPSREQAIAKVQSVFRHYIDQNRDVVDINNRIAQYMGYQIDDSLQFFNGIHYYKLTGDWKYSELNIESVRSFTEGPVWSYSPRSHERRYDNSWDELMPVVQKIRSLLPNGYFKIEFSGASDNLTLCEIHVTIRSKDFGWSRTIDTIKEEDPNPFLAVLRAIIRFINHPTDYPVLYQQ